MSIHALAEKCLIVWRLNPSTAPLEHANKMASASDVPCMSELSVAVAYVKCINKLQWNLKGACQKILLWCKTNDLIHLAIFVAAGKKAATDRFTSWLSKKRHDKTLVLHLFIVTRGASSPNEPSSLGIFVLSDLSESCEPIESLAAKNSEVVQYDNCTWLGQDCELPSRLCCFDVSFSSTCHIRK